MVETGEILRGGVGNDLTIFEQDDPGGEGESFAKVVGNEDDGFGQAPGERAEFALQFGARDGVESAEGFVHEQDRRIGGEGAGDADPLALAAGEFVGAAGAILCRLEADQGKKFVYASGGAGSVPMLQGRD